MRQTRAPRASGLLVLVAACLGLLLYQWTSTAARSFAGDATPGAPRGLPVSPPSSGQAPTTGPSSGHGRTTTGRDGGVTGEDGVLPAGVTVFDDVDPGVANLEPDLLHALRTAGAEAATERIELYVNSGWRSPAYQARLLREAVARYGSEAEAARWVAAPETSPHVSGDAVDIGSADATAWLAARGAAYGLCQVYRNEPWHFELRPQAIDRGCPRPYADPSHDPRMRP